MWKNIKWRKFLRVWKFQIDKNLWCSSHKNQKDMKKSVNQVFFCLEWVEDGSRSMWLKITAQIQCYTKNDKTNSVMTESDRFNIFSHIISAPTQECHLPHLLKQHGYIHGRCFLIIGTEWRNKMKLVKYGMRSFLLSPFVYEVENIDQLF